MGNVTIPFFATGNYEHNSDFAANTDYSGNSINNQPVSIGASGQVWAYYGCYLNIYPTGNTIGGKAVQSLLPSTHSCVVAQLVYDDAPLPDRPGRGAGPGILRQLRPAQPPDHLLRQPRPAVDAPRPADLRHPARPGAGHAASCSNYPDELMIDWGNTPVGSTASIYWPAVSSPPTCWPWPRSSTPRTSCRRPTRTRSSVSCPRASPTCRSRRGPGANFAGLFTVDLPPGVKAGQTYTITVRRISTHPPAAAPPPPPPAAADRRRSPQGGAPAAAAREICATGATSSAPSPSASR